MSIASDKPALGGWSFDEKRSAVDLNTLDFLLLVFPPEREAQKTFRAAILKTKAMLKIRA